jgi:hypothetical protein
MDADMSHDPGELPEMLAALREADVVVGSRYVSGARTDSAWGPARRLLSMVGNRGIRLAAGLEVRDATSGFKAFRTDVLRAVDFDRFKCGGFGFQAEMAIACKSLGYRVLERPISFETRASGRSKMSLGVVIEAVWRLLPLAWSRSLG